MIINNYAARKGGMHDTRVQAMRAEIQKYLKTIRDLA
jgi:hypothetical protein